MQPRREEAVAARTDQPGPLARGLGVLLWMVMGVAAASSRADEREGGWRFEEVASRFTYFNQSGSGYQSQAGPGVAGSEALGVWSPSVVLRARQNEQVQHTLFAPVDIITSASTDAIDVVTSASRTNETLTLDFNTQYKATPDDLATFRYGVHLEEWYRSVFGGLAYVHELAQDNATLGLSANGYVDVFRPYGPFGGLEPPGDKRGVRGALNVNAEVSQILSPTTLVKGSYGLTWQAGELLTPWNSVPVGCDPQVTACLTRVQERFPRSRLRHALYGLLAQHVPITQSTLRLSYRFYADDFDVRAHTLQMELYQYATARAYIRLNYRAHRQNAVYFWTRSLPLFPFDPNAPRTADSDLAEFWAHELGGKLFIYINPPGSYPQHHVDVSINHYWRTNGLWVDIVSVGYSRLF
jgi:hypothetical protein